MSKRIFISVIIIISMHLMTNGLNARDIRILKAEDKERMFSEEIILEKLNAATWENRLEIISRMQGYLSDSPELRRSQKIKMKLIELLDSGLKFERDNIENRMKHGNSWNQAMDDFYSEYGNNGYSKYITELSHLVLSYQDVETIPVLVDTLAQYGGIIEVPIFLKFGKSAINRLIQLTSNGREKQRETAYAILSAWLQWSLNENPQPDDIKLNDNVKLNAPDIEKIKETLFEGLKTTNHVQISYINYGIFAMVKNEKMPAKIAELKNKLKMALRNKEGYLRKDVAKFLGEIGDQTDLPELEKLLNDTYPDPYIEKKRKKQLKATGRTKIEPAYPVRGAALEAIEKIKARLNQ